MGLKYYAIPGIHIPADTGFQYREPGEENAFMKADEYDALIAENPRQVALLANGWDAWARRVNVLPRPGQAGK